MLFKIAQKVTKYLGTFEAVFVNKNLKISPNLVTLSVTHTHIE